MSGFLTAQSKAFIKHAGDIKPRTKGCNSAGQEGPDSEHTCLLIQTIYPSNFCVFLLNLFFFLVFILLVFFSSSFWLFCVDPDPPPLLPYQWVYIFGSERPSVWTVFSLRSWFVCPFLVHRSLLRLNLLYDPYLINYFILQFITSTIFFFFLQNPYNIL